MKPIDEAMNTFKYVEIICQKTQCSSMVNLF